MVHPLLLHHLVLVPLKEQLDRLRTEAEGWQRRLVDLQSAADGVRAQAAESEAGAAQAQGRTQEVEQTLEARKARGEELSQLLNDLDRQFRAKEESYKTALEDRSRALRQLVELQKEVSALPRGAAAPQVACGSVHDCIHG